MPHGLKSLVKRLMVLPGLDRAFAPLMQNRATVFMLHRFARTGVQGAGYDPAVLRKVLAHMRKAHYELVDLEDLVRRLAGNGPALQRAVAFTIDDGYADQAEGGAPVFAEFDCPVTTFVTTGFLDGDLWFWWDKVEYVFRRTQRERVRLPWTDPEERFLSTPVQRAQTQAAFTDWCKTVPDNDKHHAIATLAARADVDLPENAPEEYAAMSWGQVRRCEAGGMRFGPHTATHPILSRTSDAQAREEIEASWRRLREEARRPTPVFCYPNGQPGDFGVREMRLLEKVGMIAAVVGTPAYVSRAMLRDGQRAAFQLPRFNMPDDVAGVVQYASGMERLRDMLRGEGS